MKNLLPLLLALIVCINLSFSQKKKAFRKTFYFASASHELDSAELVKAKKYLKVIGKFNLTKVEIYGHTDSDGSPSYNMALSKRRVNTINSLLIEQGHDTEVLLEAKGEANPTHDNQTEKEKNRRVEVIAYYSSKKGGKKKSNVKPKPKLEKSPTKPNIVAASKEEKITKEDFKKGNTIDLPWVRFEGGTDGFLPGSEETLGKVIPILKANPTIKVEIAGHICCGNDMKLSVARAKKVYDFLVINGVDAKNLTYKGYNNTQPRYGNIMDIRNRRVELRVL